ncbi:MAG TPA: hypothetical protein VJ767_02820 [Nitrososphaeraceae archaeon]|nr:hypothetical protein [Nitrososphaeraceae archaeon]
MYNTIHQNIKKEYINIKKYFWKNQQYILLNRSIFTGIIAAVLISSLASHLTRDLEYHLNTSFTIAISYITYYTVFGLLYYHDNKEEYLLENGKLDTKKLRNILKIIFSVGIAELVYVIIRWTMHFYLLTIGYESYLTSIIAHISSAIIFAIIVNLGVKATKLFNNRYDHRDSKI